MARLLVGGQRCRGCGGHLALCGIRCGLPPPRVAARVGLASWLCGYRPPLTRAMGLAWQYWLAAAEVPGGRDGSPVSARGGVFGGLGCGTAGVGADDTPCLRCAQTGGGAGGG